MVGGQDNGVENDQNNDEQIKQGVCDQIINGNAPPLVGWGGFGSISLILVFFVLAAIQILGQFQFFLMFFFLQFFFNVFLGRQGIFQNGQRQV